MNHVKVFFHCLMRTLARQPHQMCCDESGRWFCSCGYLNEAMPFEQWWKNREKLLDEQSEEHVREVNKFLGQ